MDYLLWYLRKTYIAEQIPNGPPDKNAAISQPLASGASL
jgi:hypothetical protein